MSDDLKEFEWYTAEIEKERAACNRLWSDYSTCRRRLDELEYERGNLFRRMSDKRK